MGRVMPVLALAAALLATAAPAAAFRCGSRVVMEGDALSEVVEKCGEPLMRDTTSLGIEKRYREGVTKRSTIDIEYLFYDFGSSRFTRLLKFEDEKLRKIADGEYGGGKTDPAGCRPPWVKVAVGDGMAQVRYRCGAPDRAEIIEEITEEIGPVDDYRLSVTREVAEWEYRMKTVSASSVLRFESGILTQMYEKPDAD